MVHKAGFSATDAALAGFGLMRREPLNVLVWSVVQGLFGLALGAVTVAVAGPYMGALQRAQAARDPVAAAGALQRVAPVNLLISLLSLVLLTVIYAAVYRAVLRPKVLGLGRLRLGADELRVGLTLVVLFLLTLGLALAFALGGVLAATALSLAAPTLKGLWIVLAVAGAMAALVFAGVRLSLAPPNVFDTGRVNPFESWSLTRGRFWALLGTYLISGLLVLMAELALLAVFAAGAAAFGGGLTSLAAVFRPDMTSLDRHYTPALIVLQLGGALLSGPVAAVLAGAPAHAYAQLRTAATTAAPVSDLPRFGR